MLRRGGCLPVSLYPMRRLVRSLPEYCLSSSHSRVLRLFETNFVFANVTAYINHCPRRSSVSPIMILFHIDKEEKNEDDQI